MQRYHHKSGEGHHSVQWCSECVLLFRLGVVLFVTDSVKLGLCSASGSSSPKSTNLRSLMACTRSPRIGGKPDTGRNKSAWLSSLLPSLFAVWLVQSIDCAAPVLLADPVGCTWAAGVPSVPTFPWASHWGDCSWCPRQGAVAACRQQVSETVIIAYMRLCIEQLARLASLSIFRTPFQARLPAC